MYNFLQERGDSEIYTLHSAVLNKDSVVGIILFRSKDTFITSYAMYDNNKSIFVEEISMETSKTYQLFFMGKNCFGHQFTLMSVNNNSNI